MSLCWDTGSYLKATKHRLASLMLINLSVIHLHDRRVQVRVYTAVLNLHVIWFRLNKFEWKANASFSPCFALKCFHFVFFMQVHELDEQTWRTVEVVPIDIANKEEVAPGVSLDYGWCLMKISYKPHIKKFKKKKFNGPEYRTIFLLEHISKKRSEGFMGVFCFVLFF